MKINKLPALLAMLAISCNCGTVIISQQNAKDTVTRIRVINSITESSKLCVLRSSIYVYVNNGKSISRKIADVIQSQTVCEHTNAVLRQAADLLFHCSVDEKLYEGDEVYTTSENVSYDKIEKYILIDGTMHRSCNINGEEIGSPVSLSVYENGMGGKKYSASINKKKCKLNVIQTSKISGYIDDADVCSAYMKH